MQPLYGRGEALDRARAALDRAAQGAGRLLLFTGEPGIGKSRLAEQLAAEAEALAWSVAWGRCWEAGGAPAYWPWLQVFRSLDLGDDPFAQAAPTLAPGAAEVRFAHVLLRDRLYGELLPSARAALHGRAGSVQLARGVDPQAVVHHFFESQTEGNDAVAPEHMGEVALAAAETALSRLAFEAALRVGRRALGLCAARPLSEHLQCRLELATAEALIRLGEMSEGKQLAVRAAERAGRSGARELLARAALVCEQKADLLAFLRRL